MGLRLSSSLLHVILGCVCVCVCVCLFWVLFTYVSLVKFLLITKAK